MCSHTTVTNAHQHIALTHIIKATKLNDEGQPPNDLRLISEKEVLNEKLHMLALKNNIVNKPVNQRMILQC